MSDEPVVLRYFACSGRAQPLRYALAEAAVAFDDLRVSMADWQQMQHNTLLAGPYHALPTLTWGADTVSETLVIATFIGRRLGRYDALSDGQIATLEAICSNCYLEVLVRLGELVWADALYPGVDPGASFRRLAPRVLRKLMSVESQLISDWFCGDSPGAADFFALEAIEGLRYVFGAKNETQLTQAFPRLTNLSARALVRLNVATQRAARPARMTMRPDEQAVIARLRAAADRLDISAAVGGNAGGTIKTP
jgi:glutathione S-transferase